MVSHLFKRADKSVSPQSHPPIKRFEVTCVYSPPEATVDVVLLHGLNGNPENSWTAKNGVFWPTDLLPDSLKGAKARILVYGYNADVYAFGGDKSASSDMIHQHAQTLVSSLAIERSSEDCADNPIIWVAHSLGGILLKRALLLSNDLTSKSSNLSRSIFVSTYGIIFLGTPHNGADPAKWAMILQGLADALIPKKLMDTEPHLVKTLKSNNEVLQNINLHFLDIYQRFEIDMVHEAVKTDLKGLRTFVVDRESASPLLPNVRYYGIEGTHSSMCKFESKNAPGYLNVATTIKTWVIDCPPVIQSRWVAERRARQQVKENEAKELLGIFEESAIKSQQGSSVNTPELSNSAIISTSLVQSVVSIEPEKPSDTYFIKPPGFRPNSLFVGRDAELAEMHKMLFDKKRRAEGTSAVLLQCLPGGGKTCLARQYVYNHFDDFPGGIFWVRVKSREQLVAGFWEIARKVALKPCNNDQNSAVPQDSQQFITAVMDWFAANHNWLLVLDGIKFDHSDELRRFMPDSKNTSLIYTSTERSVGGDHHFMNPQVIRIPLLSAREAQELFLLELDKRNPTTDDLKNSMDLVQRMGFLPLVIHTVAQRLKATGEPLAKFARGYASGPKLRDLDTYKAIVEQLKSDGANEALNLIRILCFFSQHVPVEMVSLGIKTLDVPTKTFERVTGRTLNNTIKILNRFALIERNEADWIRSSQSSKGSREVLSDDVDVIRLHSVVQDFFLDSLRAEGVLVQWLQRAVSLFQRSYEMANSRIYSKTNAGLVGDYRSYEIHGKRLLDHLGRNEKKYQQLVNTREDLGRCLEAIKGEIERRTKESSQDIAQGRSDPYQISVFDRTSSSSDTGPETPGKQDNNNSGNYTWSIDGHKDPYDSPVSIKYPSDADHMREDPFQTFPLPKIEDPGYDSDRDDHMSETPRPPQYRSPPDSMMNSSTEWQTVPVRRTKDKHSPLELHRTVKQLEKNRYHDSAGAWRAINAAAADPRVTPEMAEAFIPKTTTRPPFRGRISGQSQAEVSLNQISRSSPPPLRGGAKIVVQDRSRLSQLRKTLNDRGVFLTAGDATTAPSEINNSAYTEMPRQIIQDRSPISPSFMFRPATPAMDSLQRFSPPTYQTLMPESDDYGGGYDYERSYQFLDENRRPIARLDHQENRNNHSMHQTQAMSLPVEFMGGSTLQRDRQRDFQHWNYQEYGTPPYPENNLYVSSSNAARRRSYDRNGQTGVFERDPNTYYESGYTSQPMSRGPSGNSERGARRPSIAATEPAADLSNLSPRIPPTSYQLYENMRERKSDSSTKKSSRPAFVRAAKTANSEEGNYFPNISRSEIIAPLHSRTFNPHAPIFLPRTQSQPPIGPLRFPPPSPPSPKFARNTPYPQDPHPNRTDGISSPPMTPTNPAGVRVGRRLIGFGDFPELVDSDVARARAERQRADRRAFDDGRFRDHTDRDGQRQPQRPRLAPPNAQASPSALGQARSISDIEEGVKNGPAATSGRRRRVSSPEEAVGLGITAHRSGSASWMRDREEDHSGLGESMFGHEPEMHLSRVAGM